VAEPTESVTLYGGKARRFREVQAILEDRRGWEPSNAEVVAYLLAQFDEDGDKPPRASW